MEEKNCDCHYCEYACCDNADSEIVSCNVDDGYFDHYVNDSSEAKKCSSFRYCDSFPKW